MEGSLRFPPLARLLALNTEISEMRTELMRQPFASGRIAELQEGIDRHYRSSLATCWLTGGYDLEPDDDDPDGDLGDGYASAD